MSEDVSGEPPKRKVFFLPVALALALALVAFAEVRCFLPFSHLHLKPHRWVDLHLTQASPKRLFEPNSRRTPETELQRSESWRLHLLRCPTAHIVRTIANVRRSSQHQRSQQAPRSRGRTHLPRNAPNAGSRNILPPNSKRCHQVHWNYSASDLLFVSYLRSTRTPSQRRWPTPSWMPLRYVVRSLFVWITKGKFVKHPLTHTESLMLPDNHLLDPGGLDLKLKPRVSRGTYMRVSVPGAWRLGSHIKVKKGGESTGLDLSANSVAPTQYPITHSQLKPFLLFAFDFVLTFTFTCAFVSLPLTPLTTGTSSIQSK
jgi:hypothetical protein